MGREAKKMMGKRATGRSKTSQKFPRVTIEFRAREEYLGGLFVNVHGILTFHFTQGRSPQLVITEKASHRFDHGEVALSKRSPDALFKEE